MSELRKIIVPFLMLRLGIVEFVIFNRRLEYTSCKHFEIYSYSEMKNQFLNHADSKMDIGLLTIRL